ncbi:hypothetical protein BCR43DRAFT_510895 [Syncephalastrum racemosum]|uniref:Uncharacterized protein n=1 Tax=Syncephalastrum racemosum TaxID=13706 RepID=A0A1X2HWA3_SYNRA|nr:hypothetical protein BCR43DRAFT_510895 [Syncephalastrum racemosum]
MFRTIRLLTTAYAILVTSSLFLPAVADYFDDGIGELPDPALIEKMKQQPYLRTVNLSMHRVELLLIWITFVESCIYYDNWSGAGIEGCQACPRGGFHFTSFDICERDMCCKGMCCLDDATIHYLNEQSAAGH